MTWPSKWSLSGWGEPGERIKKGIARLRELCVRLTEMRDRSLFNATTNLVIDDLAPDCCPHRPAADAIQQIEDDMRIDDELRGSPAPLFIDDLTLKLRELLDTAMGES